MACESSCEPSRPCNADGCPNAQQEQAQPEGTEPSLSPDPSPSLEPSPSPPASEQEPSPSSPASEEASDANGTVRIGVGNTSASDINIEVNDNLVTGGRNRVHLGSDNHAAGANTGFISGNVADGDDLLIGVDNHSAGGNNNIQVYDNDFRGFKSVQVGVGNYARGSNTIIVGGPRPPRGPDIGGRPSQPPPPSAPPRPLLPGAPPPLPPLPPPSGFGPLQPYEPPPYGPRAFGPIGPYHNVGAYYGGNTPGARMWGYYAASMGTNPGGMSYNMPPFGNPPR